MFAKGCTPVEPQHTRSSRKHRVLGVHMGLCVRALGMSYGSYGLLVSRQVHIERFDLQPNGRPAWLSEGIVEIRP